MRIKESGAPGATDGCARGFGSGSVLIVKKINNNVAVAATADRGECVVFGKGVGFPQMPYELEDESVIQRTFVSPDEVHLASLTDVSDEVLLATLDIAALARDSLDCKLSANLPFVLADHLQFAVDRTAEGLVIENPLSLEVAFIYPREHAVGQRGLDLVEARVGTRLPDCEAASIAMHVVTAELDGNCSVKNMDLVIKSAEVIDEITRIVEAQGGRPIDRSDYAYMRFVAHLRYLVSRLLKDGPDKPTENSSLFRQAAVDFPECYRCAAAINNYLMSSHNWSCSNEELLYLMMHINRLWSS